MRKLIFVALIFLSFSCSNKEDKYYFTAEKATDIFKKIEDICNKDNGKLWGSNLNGPLMFVERSTRKITSNSNDRNSLLKIRDGVFTGTYPRENIVTTSAVTYGGTLFGLVPLPPEEDDNKIISRALHSLFHRYQETMGMHSEYFNAVNMDDKQARIWIKLEWKALRKAIESDSSEQAIALRDALIFRGSSREMFPKYIEMQNRFEVYQGLAAFTSYALTTDSQEEFNIRLFRYLDRVYSMQSFARTYGAVHGALYATLLSRKGYDFSSIKLDTIDLAVLVKDLYNIELPPVCRDVAGSIALNYGIDEITREEDKRIIDIKERLGNLASVFTQKPVVYLELESPSFDFEPEDIHYLDTLGTLYHNIRVSDNWGKLTVEKTGCLISNNYKFMRITAKGIKTDKNHISGDGWQLIINEGWTLDNSQADYFLRKLAP